MCKMLFSVAVAALLLGGCYVEETPRYAPRCYTVACVSQPSVVVKVRTPSPAPAVTRAPAIAPPPAPAIGPARRGRCFFRRARWVRVWQGWRRVPGRWICKG